MNSLLATVVCFCGIAGLFYLNRDRSLRTTKALWLPTIWICLIGSRPVSVWLGIRYAGRDVQLDGSPVDAAFLGVLMAAAIGVLIRRSGRVSKLLAANWPILIYFFYCLISVAWSYHPDVAFKRWIKSIGDLAMVLVIVTEPRLHDALYRLFSRVGFLLFPTSVLFIKYFGNLGRGYTPDGAPMNTGVATNKNMLGMMLLVISLGTVWYFITLLRAKGRPNRGRQLLAQGTLLVFGIALFLMANSATSSVCFVLGSTIIFATGLRAIKKRRVRVHMLCLGLILAGGFAMILGGSTFVTNMLGRKSNFSGRTEIWAALIPSVPNPIVGAGFESYWISPAVLNFQSRLLAEGWWHPEGLNEAHNGYIEVYLELGLVGVGLIALILITGYRRAVAAYRLNASLGGLMLAYVMVAAVYGITEAGFRMMALAWIFLQLAVVSANGIVAGFIQRESPKIHGLRGATASRKSDTNGLIPEGETVYAAQRGLT